MGGGEGQEREEKEEEGRNTTWEERGLSLEPAGLHSVAVEPLQDKLARPLFRSLAFLPKAPVLTKGAGGGGLK